MGTARTWDAIVLHEPLMGEEGLRARVRVDPLRSAKKFHRADGQMATGFVGRACEEVARALVEYGHSVILAWIVTGLVFVRCRERGFGGDQLQAPRGGIPRAQAKELASDTVAEAIVHFRDRVLRTGRWDPAKGASLTTFFIGNCLLQFPNLYRKWRRQWLAELRHETLESAATRAGGPDPAKEVIDRQVLLELYEQIPARDRPMAALIAAGYRIDEIAEILGGSYKSIESRLYRLRTATRLARTG